MLRVFGCAFFAAIRLTSAAAGTVAANSLPPSVCGPHPEDVSQCNRQDMGSCGNACCVVDFAWEKPPALAHEEVAQALGSGLDGQYEHVTGGEPDPPEDKRAFHIERPRPFQFALQGLHSAPKYRGENADIININIAADTRGSGSIVRMFSVSRIHGALGDNGQNYKTLAYLASALGVSSGEFDIVHGCGAEPAKLV